MHRELEAATGHAGNRETIARALRSPIAKRIYFVLTVLLVLLLWANMVRRAMNGSGSRFDNFVAFSRDLIYERVDVYREYDWERTSIGKYPPFFGFLFAPFVPIPVALAASLWFFVNVGLAAGAAYFSVRTVAESDAEQRPLSMYLIPFILASGIIGSNLETAQVNIVILFFICLGLFGFRRGSDVKAGLSLGLATALKLTPGLFIAYFAYKRAFGVVVGAAIALVICWLIIPSLVLGPDHFATLMSGWYARLSPFVAEGTLAEGVTGFRHTNQSLSAAFHRFFTVTPAGGGRSDFYLNVLALDYQMAGRIVKVVSLALLTALALACRTPVDDRSGVGLALEYSLVIIVALFISPISWINHYVVLLFPYAAAVYYVRARPAGSPERRLMLYSTILSFLLVSSSASRLMQALSLPLLGALVLAVAMGVVLVRERQGSVEIAGGPGTSRPVGAGASGYRGTLRRRRQQ